MELLLLFLVVISVAVVLVGGELVRYSTDVIYVSDDGKDNGNCLNGGSHCKTLGHVLTNIPMLQCSNCTVMVTYDHIVGLVSCSAIVDIGNVEVLHIVGIGQPSLYFNKHTLVLANTDNTTSVIIENLEFHNCTCVQYGECMPCISMKDGYYLLNFSIINLTLRQVNLVSIVAKNTYCHSSYFESTNILELKTSGVGNSEILVLNSTFRDFEIMIYAYGTSQNSSIIIRQCHFMHSISLSAGGGNINFNINECHFDSRDCSSQVSFNIDTWITGSMLITNNHFTMTMPNECLSTIEKLWAEPYIAVIYYDIQDQLRSSLCYDTIAIKYYNNTFVNNVVQTMLYFENLANIDIGDSVFRDNVVSDHAVSVQCYSGTSILIHDSIFINNSINAFPTADRGAILGLLCPRITLYHLNFTTNRGTPLSIIGSEVNISGDIVFINNNAITGGGMYITKSSHGANFSDGSIIITDTATVSFINNVAAYGGAIYVDQNSCFLTTDYRNDSIIFVANRASYSGPSVFSAYDWCSFCNNVTIQNGQVESLPTILSFNRYNTTSVFPGQTIVGDVTLINCFGSVSSCLTDVSLQCNGKVCRSYGIRGPSIVFLSNGTVNTELKIIAVSEHISTNRAQVKFVCKSSTTQLPPVLIVEVTVLPCPIGFIFNSLTGQCDCINSGNEHVICDKDKGLVCVEKGYWYSNSSGTASKCIHLLCDYSKNRKVCPSAIASTFEEYQLLGDSQDNQCVDGHGGTLCTGCADNKVPTYGALRCIDSDKCAKWHPYLLISLNIVIPFVNGVLLIIIIRLKLSIGSGYLYGPLFYLAVLNLIPFTSYSTLNTIVSSFFATLLIKLEFLGYIPWCFLSSVSLLTSKWFELIGPLVVTVVLLLTIYLARCSPRLLGRLQESPLQAICLLVLVLFWSLASTAISIITPTYLAGVKEARVHLQPDLAYLGGDHIPLWIISVITLLVLYSIVLVFMSYQFLNLSRFKPVLDEFQSCFQDNYRWYGGMYFIVWSILQASVLSSNYRIFQTVIIVLTVTHCLLQPYCRKWLNMIDTFFLSNLNITSCLALGDSMQEHTSNSVITKVLVYISVMGPLCLILSGIAFILMATLGVTSKCMGLLRKVRFQDLQCHKRAPQSKAMHRPIATTNRKRPYREPLIINCDSNDSDDSN